VEVKEFLRTAVVLIAAGGLAIWASMLFSPPKELPLGSNDNFKIRTIFQQRANRYSNYPDYNNPGRIRSSKINWKGEVPCKPWHNSSFECFKSEMYGQRAALIILLNYQAVHKLYTIEKMIGRWAPPIENSTEAYVRYVAQAMGKHPSDFVDVLKRTEVTRMLLAMFRYETGLRRSPEETAAVIDNIFNLYEKDKVVHKLLSVVYVNTRITK